ncbi:MAG: Ig-like domain repeat protein [Labilithrix sp.]|nr:Ig-like domain repeat protein [Labilithrix sp.]MCW5812024.1 Ig-like domain repeat protein [Labilithrix sp.]
MKHPFWIVVLGFLLAFTGCDLGGAPEDARFDSVKSAGNVMPGATWTSVYTSHYYNESSYGEPVELRAEVCPSNETDGTPSGNLTFHIDGQSIPGVYDGGSQGCGQWTLIVSDMSVTGEGNSHQISATYAGNPPLLGSSSEPFWFRVYTAYTFTTIEMTLGGPPEETDVVYGEPLEFKVRVRRGYGQEAIAAGAGVVPLSHEIQPTGEVSLVLSPNGKGGGQSRTLGPMNLVPDVEGTATATFRINPATVGGPLDVGSWIVDAEYTDPNENFNDSATYGRCIQCVGFDTWDEQSYGIFVFVGSAGTNMTFGANAPPPFLGVSQSIPLSVTLTSASPSEATPNEGVVDFTITPPGPGTPIVLPVNVVNGVASTTHVPGAPLPLGVYSVSASFRGSERFGGAEANASFEVKATQFTLALTSSATPASDYTAVYGKPVTFTATIVGEASVPPDPLGNVVFYDGDDVISTRNIGTHGTSTPTGETYTTTVTTQSLFLAAGAHTIRAVYAGDLNYQNPSGAPGTDSKIVLITPHASTFALTSSPRPSQYGQEVTLTANVGVVLSGDEAPPSPPAGHVEFFLSPPASDAVPPIGSAPVDAGVATFTTRTLPVATPTGHALFGRFVPTVAGGNSNYSSSQGQVATPHQVQRAATSVALSSGSTLNVVGQEITFTALVDGQAGTGGPWKKSGEGEVLDPTLISGPVTFFDGADPIGTATMSVTSDAKQQYTFKTTALAVGVHTITAVYDGNTLFAPSPASNGLTQVVNQDGVSATLSSSANPSTFGANVTFTARLSSTTGGAPTGTITFMSGSTTIGTAPLAGSPEAVATFTTAALGAGTHTIVASYSGDPNHPAGPAASIVQTVNGAPTTTALTSSANPAAFGQNVTLTATVSSTADGDKTAVVTFLDGSTVLGTALASAAGVATLSTSSLTIGAHSLRASYAGNPRFAASSGALTQNVTKGGSTIVVASSANPSLLGTSVSLIATVAAAAPASGVPTGIVTFRENGVVLGTATLSASGVATIAVATLGEGDHPIVASYAGDTRFNSATAEVFTQGVSASAATIVVTTSPSPSRWSGVVTITATLTGSSPTGAPTGTVEFRRGPTVIGTAPVNASGVATAATALLDVGTTTIDARYSGDSAYATVTGSVAHTVDKAETTTTISSSKASSNAGEPVTITASVTSPAGAVAGEVEFFAGATSLGTVALSGGSASFTATTFVTGDYELKATYKGNDRFESSSSSVLSQRVNAAPDGGAGSTSGGPGTPPGSTPPPGVGDGGLGVGTIDPGSVGSGGDDCSVANPGTSSTGFGAFVGLACTLLALARRRRSHPTA